MIERGYVVGVEEDYRRAVPRAARAGRDAEGETGAAGTDSETNANGTATARNGNARARTGEDPDAGAGPTAGPTAAGTATTTGNATAGNAAAGDSADLRFVELLVGGAHPRKRLREEAGALAALVEAHGLGLVVELPVGPDLASPHDAVRRAARRTHEAAIEAARAAGARTVLLRARTDPARPDGAQGVRGRFVASVRDLDSYADHCGVRLCVANAADPRFPVPWFDRLFEATDAAMALDVARARRAGLSAVEAAAFLRTYGDRIPHVRLLERPGRDLDGATGAATTGAGAAGGAGEDRREGDRSVDPATLAEATDWRGTVAVRSRAGRPDARNGEGRPDGDGRATAGRADRVGAGPPSGE